MDKKTKILNRIFLATIIFSLAITFYKTIVLQDFVIINYEENGGDEEGVEEEIIENVIEENI
jgi:hypothetical protein